MLQVTSIYQIKKEFSSPSLFDLILRDELKDFSFQYVGRVTEQYPGSPLGNPFKIGRDGTREEVIQKYRQWLWVQVQEGLKGNHNPAYKELIFLAKKHLHEKNLTLICWCHPKPCHADIIKSCIEWMIRERIVS